MTPPGPCVLAVLAHLAEVGEATHSEIARALGLSRTHAASLLNRMSKPGKILPKRVYVETYTNDDEVGQPYPRPVYRLGNKPNAKRPPRDPRAIARNYRKRNNGQITSVFDLARTGRGRRALVKI